MLFIFWSMVFTILPNTLQLVPAWRDIWYVAFVEKFLQGFYTNSGLGTYSVFYILGYALHAWKSKKKYLFIPAGLLAFIVSTWFLYESSLSHGYAASALSILGAPQFVFACGIFVLFDALPKLSAYGYSVITYVAQRIFGMYLVHDIFLQWFHLQNLWTSGEMIFVQSVAIWLLSFVASTLLSYVPLIRKYLV